MTTRMIKWPVTMKCIEHLLVPSHGSHALIAARWVVGGQGCEQQRATMCDFMRWASSYPYKRDAEENK